MQNWRLQFNDLIADICIKYQDILSRLHLQGYSLKQVFDKSTVTSFNLSKSEVTQMNI